MSDPFGRRNVKKGPVDHIDVKVPVNDEVGPQVADHPGDLPVEEGEVEDAGREQVDQLVTMGNAPVDHVIEYLKMCYQIFQ